MILGTPGISSGLGIPDWFFASILLGVFVVYHGIKLALFVLYQLNEGFLEEK
jgi:hypothetical protein